MTSSYSVSQPSPVPCPDAGPGVAADACRLRRMLEEVVAPVFSVARRGMRSRGDGRSVGTLARQCAMYLAHVALGLTYTEVARTFRRDRTTAAHACRRIEERRDDPLIDALLDALEADAIAAVRAREDVGALA